MKSLQKIIVDLERAHKRVIGDIESDVSFLTYDALTDIQESIADLKTWPDTTINVGVAEEVSPE